jgi:hypothetical protein
MVVRNGTTWSFAPLPGDVSRTVSLDEVIALAGPAERPPDPASDPLPDDQLVTALWAFAAAPSPDGLMFEHPDGTLAAIDAADVRLLSATTTTIRIDDLAAETGIARTAERAARLVELGLLHRGRPPVPAGPAARANDEPMVRPAAIAPSGGPAPGGPAGRIPVYAIWHPEVGPLLALGMLTASARHHAGGALNDRYEIRRPESADEFLADLATRQGPAVLLCSDYVWSLDANLAAARAAVEINPDLVVIHGGPSSPKYEGDAERFLTEHRRIAHVLARGEGELLISELLTKIADTLPALDPAVLRTVDGITFRDTRTGEVVRNPDRDRISDLAALPSPYLTGEFDHIDGASWNTCLSVETNRGCPYSCSFCDWGSSTMSRIRMFDFDRVRAEFEWAAQRGISAINIPDANFGIMSRDVATAAAIAEVKERTGHPEVLVFYPAKNTTKHFVRIMDILGAASISSAASLSLQTTDEDTLAAIDRANISTDHFVALAADYRRRGHPLLGDLLLGIPGQTYESYRRDLQFMLDQEILVRTWPTQILPNAPMNDPAYRAEHGIEYDDEMLITSTSSFTDADRGRMAHLRKLDIICERLGLLRHVLRFAQWDHGIDATVVTDHLVDLCRDDPLRYPHLTWALNYFDLHPVSPAGWGAFYDEAGAMLREDFGVPASSALDTVLAVNRFLMPSPGRSFPETLPLDHDYVAYYFDATRGLVGDGRPTTPTVPLAEMPRGHLTVAGDPIGLCNNTMVFEGDSRNERMQGEFQVGSSVAYELQSPLARLLPAALARGVVVPNRSDSTEAGLVREFEQDVLLQDGAVEPAGPVAVSIGKRPLER